jgi:hypothetical protein
LLGKYPLLTYCQIIRRERRRRCNRRLRTFLRWLKKFLIGAALIMPSAAHAQDNVPIEAARVIAQALNVRPASSAASAQLGVLRRGI